MEFIRRGTDYALAALVPLAEREGQVLSVSHLAREARLPETFLRKVLQRLSQRGVVRSHPGPRGGFSLAKDPKKLNLLELLQALQGPIVLNRCLLGKKSCPRMSGCALTKNWRKLQKKFATFFTEVTFAELARGSPRARRKARFLPVRSK